jgi:hypothetical protein
MVRDRAHHRFMHEKESGLPPLVKGGLLHVQFESIHPFLDGNGRLGRLLVTLFLCAHGVLHQPLLYLSLFFKTHRQDYYRLLQEVRERGAWEAWLEFFLEGVAETANQAFDAAGRIVALFREIAQSLNQIEKAYGQNNSILDNCHIRVSFTTNDERTAKRVSDALGTATERRAMKNYAGNRLSPWLGHVMVSRAETARPLLTAGEVMQLPPTDEIVMISGVHPVRAKKVRYFEDRRFAERILPPPVPVAARSAPKPDDWSALPLPPRLEVVEGEDEAKTPADATKPDDDPANAGPRREPGLEPHKDIAPPARPMDDEFGAGADKANGVAARTRRMTRIMQRLARQISLDPDDDMDM